MTLIAKFDPLTDDEPNEDNLPDIYGQDAVHRIQKLLRDAWDEIEDLWCRMERYDGALQAARAEIEVLKAVIDAERLLADVGLDMSAGSDRMLYVGDIARIDKIVGSGDKD
jgi:hypothetical protein